jgi:hypothetical protein
MVDAADQEKIEASKNELHNLLDKPQLQGIPVSWRWSGWERELIRNHGAGAGEGGSAVQPRYPGILALTLPGLLPV